VEPLSTFKNETSGQAILLYESQINVGTGESYVRICRQVLNETGVEHGSQLSFDFDPSYQELTVHTVWVLRQTNAVNQMDRKKFRVIQQEKDLDRNIYNGTWSAICLLEDVRPGDVIDCSYTVKGTNPILENRFANMWFAQWEVPVQHQRYRLICPASRRVFIQNRNTNVQPKVTRTDEETEYIWNWSNLPALATEVGTPNWYTTHPEITVSEYANWGEVAKWACKLYVATNEISPELANTMRLWRLNKRPEVRAAAAVQFVQDQVRYMGIEFGPHSHEPTDPSTVFARRFGDCKDKVFLLCTMLRKLGVTAKPVLVNSVVRRGIEIWQPSPFVFNHVVVQLVIDDKTYYVDPTLSQQRGQLTDRYFPDYRFGLVVDPETTQLVEIAPMQTGAPHTQVTEAYSFIGTNGMAFLKVKTRASGLDADYLRRAVSQVSQTELDKSYLNYYASAFSGIEQVSSVKIYDDEKSNSVDTEESYRIPNMWTLGRDGRNGCSFFARTIHDLLAAPFQETRKAPFAIYHPANKEQTIEIDHQDKWRIKPDRREVRNQFFHFTSDLTDTGTHTTLHFTYRTLTDSVPAADVPSYKRAVNQVIENLTFSVTKPVPSPVSHDPNWAIIGIGFCFSSLVLVGGVFACRYQPTAPPPLPVADTDKHLEGLGGWLTVICILLVIGIVAKCGYIVRTWPVYSLGSWQALTMPGSPEYNSMWAPTLIFGLLFNLGMTIYTVFLLILFFKKRRLFPTLFVLFLTVQFLGVALDSALIHMVKGTDAKAFTNPVAMILGALIWGSYIQNSRRVKATFVR
jgi:transglutaminase-like putative cysteine protease